MKLLRIYILTFLFLIISVSIKAQTFGFGCLGMSSFYGGYGIHSYEAVGLNESIPIKFNSIEGINKDFNFEQGTGFRFGINILRADFHSVFLTAKAFYQFSKETKSAQYLLINNNADFDFELTTNHWGFGIDFGFPVFSFVDLKLAEGGVTFYQIEFQEKVTIGDDEPLEEVYKNDGVDIGYYVGTGLVLNLVRGYISVEGTAMYHFLSVDKLENSNGSFYPVNTLNKKFIDKGGFAAVIQLNIGFPL